MALPFWKRKEWGLGSVWPVGYRRVGRMFSVSPALCGEDLRQGI